jgi:predicted transcriptional regulator
MQITLTPELERQFQQFLLSGTYRSEQDVLRAALDALDAEEATFAAIAEGLDDMQAGRCRPFDEADSEFRNQHNMRPLS